MAKPGPKPIGERATTSGERTARHRARKKAGLPPVKHKPP
jgi:hypothetical protein